MDKKGILEQFGFFRQAGAAVRENMLSHAQLASLPEGAMFVTDGDETDSIALVGAGRIRVYKTSESGREITLYEVKAGDFCVLNLLCVLTGIRAPATARVEQAVQAVVFKGADFRRWIGSDPAIRSHMFALLGHSVADIMGLVEEIAFKKMDVRLAEYLQAKLRGSDTAVVETTHETIALDLGSAREVISRLLKEFERQGAVTMSRGRITINDAGLLKSLACGA